MKKELTLAKLSTWLGAQPADKTYDTYDGRKCAMFQCLKAFDYPVDATGWTSWCDTGGNHHATDIPFGVLALEPSTFGAAYQRSLAALQGTLRSTY